MSIEPKVAVVAEGSVLKVVRFENWELLEAFGRGFHCGVDVRGGNRGLVTVLDLDFVEDPDLRAELLRVLG